jgi:hypothetical protein
MATTTEIQEALANEARLQAARLKKSNLQGQIDATASAVQKLNSVNSDAQIALTEVQAMITSLESGSGAGITADFGPKSTVTQLVETERFAAKAAAVDFVKANPDCSEEQARDAWNAAALASHPDFPQVIQEGLVMSALYRANLLKAGLIREDSWEAHRQWILVTNRSAILAA